MVTRCIRLIVCVYKVDGNYLQAFTRGNQLDWLSLASNQWNCLVIRSSFLVGQSVYLHCTYLHLVTECKKKFSAIIIARLPNSTRRNYYTSWPLSSTQWKITFKIWLNKSLQAGSGCKLIKCACVHWSGITLWPWCEVRNTDYLFIIAPDSLKFKFLSSKFMC